MSEAWTPLDRFRPDPGRPGFLLDPERPGWLRTPDGRWWSAADVDHSRVIRDVVGDVVALEPYRPKAAKAPAQALPFESAADPLTRLREALDAIGGPR